ncbi:MAG: hypothetical protein R3327_07025 [Nitrosopumilaceae archaeon]|nr:hypothetical protein [Nitrosopumilaceae archaeon]
MVEKKPTKKKTKTASKSSKKTPKTKQTKTKSKKTTTKGKNTKSKKKAKSESYEDMGIVIVDDDLTIDKEKVNEERRAYLEEARSQEAFD